MKLNLMRSTETRHLTGSSNSRLKTSQSKIQLTPLQAICLHRPEKMSILTQWGLWKGPKDLVTLPWVHSRTETSLNHNKTTFGRLTLTKRLERSRRASSRSTLRSPSRDQKAPKSTIFPRKPSLRIPLPLALCNQTVQTSSSKLLQTEAQWSKTLKLPSQETIATSSSPIWTSTST